MSHRRASKLSVKLVPKPCRDLNNRKSLAANPHRQIPKKLTEIRWWNRIESNTKISKLQGKNKAERTISFCEWKHFDLISIKMKATAKTVEHNKWQLRCACVYVCGWTTANTWAETRVLVDACLLALPWSGLPWLLIKCQIASISAGHMWRTPTHSNRNSYSYSSSTELYIWIIEFEFGIEWRRLLLLLLPSLPTIQFKRLFATQSLAENIVVNTQRAELSDGRSFISFGWRVRASHAQSAKCCLPVAAAASQTSICNPSLLTIFYLPARLPQRNLLYAIKCLISLA